MYVESIYKYLQDFRTAVENAMIENGWSLKLCQKQLVVFGFILP
jgi:hypothetical protein